MIIDFVFVILMAMAIFKGLSKGFMIAIFSVLGFIIGIAAALKLSAIVAVKMGAISNLGKWLPALSFLLVFIATALIVNLAGKLIQKTFETVMLGWLNRIAGVLLYAFLYSVFFSIFLFYAVQLRFLKPDVITASVIYPILQPLGPFVINSIGVIIPWFKNVFAQLETFFSNYATSPDSVK